MSREIGITQLVENTAGGRGLLGEHGIAYFIEVAGRRVLFDTGQGEVLLHNAERLGLPLAEVEAIALSHGHYDHAGGLEDALSVTGPVDLYLHPEARQPKYNRAGKAIGTPYLASDALRGHVRRLVETREPVSIGPGIHLTGEIPRRHKIEDTGGPFHLDANRNQVDPLLDDQAMYLDTADGTLVLLGCGHSGVINTLEHIQQLTGGSHIHAVIGGMHLLRATPERLDFTAQRLEALGVEYLAPIHCTGTEAACFFRARFPDRIHASEVGTLHAFRRLQA
ncbi:MBL fold metallo-hydrolase [Thiorhodococcus mannitoliphagus]|uniref:MBL fold metallo-hydrolase n=1 Tax=Thiorhodococcus mannitoliphagus TaxID=329406 RepID=A0A6P1DXB8_9GAMM|nr:MBL fold metallo-hydrolase [Thiorhodococcus mannitoliphagus]NEX22828.1 MBL fold metallo-hydrolase [Thiorhodococcus mannitoliphagus]